MSADLPADIRDWPPAVPLWPAIAAALPIGRPRAYQMAAAGELPFVRRLGTRHVIITSQLKAYLGLASEGTERPAQEIHRSSAQQDSGTFDDERPATA